MNTPSTAAPSAATPKTVVLPDNLSTPERRLERFKMILEKLKHADTKGDGETRLLLDEMDREVEGMKKGANPEVTAAIAAYEQKKRELAPLQAEVEAERKKLARPRYLGMVAKVEVVKEHVEALRGLAQDSRFTDAVRRQITLAGMNASQTADKKALEEKIASSGDMGVLEEAKSALKGLQAVLENTKQEINRTGEENDVLVIDQKMKGGAHTPALTKEVDPAAFEANGLSTLDETVQQVLALPVVADLSEIEKELKSLEKHSVQKENTYELREKLRAKKVEVAEAFQATQKKHAPAKMSQAAGTQEVPEGQQDLVDAGNRE